MKTTSTDDIKAAFSLLSEQIKELREVKEAWDNLTEYQKIRAEIVWGHLFDFNQFRDLMPKMEFEKIPKLNEEKFVYANWHKVHVIPKPCL